MYNQSTCHNYGIMNVCRVVFGSGVVNERMALVMQHKSVAFLAGVHVNGCLGTLSWSYTGGLTSPVTMPAGLPI